VTDDVDEPNGDARFGEAGIDYPMVEPPSVVECPVCRTKHISGHHFRELPRLTIDGMVFSQFKDLQRRQIIIQWLNRDRYIIHFRERNAVLYTENQQLQRNNSSLRDQLAQVTEQRDVYFLSLKHLAAIDL
jgi:hypothetical protein